MKINQKLINLNKKFGLSLLAASLVIGNSSGVFAKPISICVQNQKVNLGSNIPYVSNTNQTMIPIRAVGNVLGLNTSWQNGIVILSGKNVKTNKMTYAKANVNTKTLVVDGKTITNAVQLKNGTTYIALRALSEAFGYNVGWNNGTVNISNSKGNNAQANTQTESKPSTPSTQNKPGTQTTQNTQTTSNNSVSNTVSAYETEVLNLVNIERQKAGLSSLKMDEALRNVARKKSEDMRIKGYFSHTSPTYGSPFDMMKQFGISYTMAGENIAMGQRTPQEVVTAWMNSSGHRANILKSGYTHIGVGYDVNGNYWTQMFIKK